MWLTSNAYSHMHYLKSHTVPWIYIPEGVVLCRYYLTVNQGGILLAEISASPSVFLLLYIS